MNTDIQCCRAQSRSVTFCTRRISPITRKDDAVVHLICMCLQLADISFQAVESPAPTFPDRFLFMVIEQCPRHIEPHIRFFCYSNKIVQITSEFLSCPTADSPLSQCLLFVRHDEIHVNTNGAAE